MGELSDYNVQFARIDTATTAIADVITRQVERLREKGLSKEQEAQILDRLTAVAHALEPMGKDPANSVPIEPPTAEPGEGGGEPSA